MGKVRTKTVKKSAKVLVEKYYGKLTTDFQVNKKLTQEVAIMPSKKMRNKVAGYVTTLMKRIGRGPVRGISLKLQEEERERRLDFVPERSALETDRLGLDKDSFAMLQSLQVGEIKGTFIEPILKPTAGGGASERPRRDRKQ